MELGGISADGWGHYKDPASRYYSEPRNHCLAPGGSEYGRYLWVRDQIEPRSLVLDVGCNCGQLAENLTTDLGCQVVGVDVIPDFVQYCQQEKAKFGTFVCGDFGELGFRVPEIRAGDFDSITALEVIEHAINLRVFRFHVRNLLRPGGKLIVTVPHPRGIIGYGHEKINNAHWRMWTTWRLVQVFGPMLAYADIRRDECGRLLSMGAVFKNNTRGG